MSPGGKKVEGRGEEAKRREGEETNVSSDASDDESRQKRASQRTSGNLPSESFKSSLLHRISDDLTVLEENESVR